MPHLHGHYLLLQSVDYDMFDSGENDSTRSNDLTVGSSPPERHSQGCTTLSVLTQCGHPTVHQEVVLEVVVNSIEENGDVNGV